MSSLIETGVEPRYTHDCNVCVFLGRCGSDDLYFCNGSSSYATVIARHSSDPADYISGMELIKFVPSLAIAHSLAVQSGLI